MINAGTLTYSNGANALGVAPPAVAVPDYWRLNGGALKFGNGWAGNPNVLRGIYVAGGGGTLTVESAAAFNYAGVISGPGAFNKNGAQNITLLGVNTYTGPTIISGPLTIGATGLIAATPAITLRTSILDVSAVTGGFNLLAAQTLAGVGTVVGPIGVQGTISPGETSVDTLTFSGALTLSATATYNVDIVGTVNGDVTGNDLIVAGGAVSLGNATLTVVALSPYLASAHGGEALTIISKSGTVVIADTFAGLAEGSTFSAAGTQFTISYIGGDGNDVVLTSVPEPTTIGMLSIAGFGLLRRRRAAK